MSYIEKLNQQKADIFQFYKTVDGLRLPIQVFLPDFFDKTCTYPTVIAIHGGGWNALKETPADWDGGWMANNVKYYREKGYVGIVFSYRDFAICPDGVGGIWSYCAKEPMPYSPVHHIKKLDAKILVMHGTSNSVVAIDDSRVFTEKMKGSGNEITTMEVPNAEHAFILFGYTNTEENILEVLKKTDEFFDL